MVKLQYSKPALEDLRALFLYISADSPSNAKRFTRQLKDRIKILKSYPEMGKPVFPEKFSNLRQVLHKSYRIIYEFEESVVTVIAIHHQSRLIENITAVKKYII